MTLSECFVFACMRKVRMEPSLTHLPPLGSHDCDQHAALTTSSANKSASEGRPELVLYGKLLRQSSRGHEPCRSPPRRASQLHGSHLLPGSERLLPAPHSLAKRPLAPLFFDHLLVVITVTCPPCTKGMSKFVHQLIDTPFHYIEPPSFVLSILDPAPTASDPLPIYDTNHVAMVAFDARAAVCPSVHHPPGVRTTLACAHWCFTFLRCCTTRRGHRPYTW